MVWAVASGAKQEASEAVVSIGLEAKEARSFGAQCDGQILRLLDETVASRSALSPLLAICSMVAGRY